MFFENSLPRIFKYPLLVWKTLLLLHKERPKVLIVQNPSLVLSFFALLMRPVFKYCLIIDAHNIGVVWYGGGRWFFQPILKMLHRYANITIVTNEPLSEIVIAHGGIPFILPDAIPDFGVINRTQAFSKDEQFIITFINTFSSDEPYKAVFEASKLLPNNVLVYATGNVDKVGDIRQFGCEKNVVFKGYIPEDEYLDLLSKSHCIIDLTTRDNCLVCGAYEALALGVPMVLSDTMVTRQLFNKGVAYTKANATNISEAIIDIMGNHSQYQKQLLILRDEFQVKWDLSRKKLLKMISDKCIGSIL
jgi:glycosyltransferase involved in cell wall biosynthesis